MVYYWVNEYNHYIDNDQNNPLPVEKIQFLTAWIIAKNIFIKIYIILHCSIFGVTVIKYPSNGNYSKFRGMQTNNFVVIKAF